MARKLYTPKPLDPGATIDVRGTAYTVWSAGPGPATLWAFDAEGRWAVVRVRKGQPDAVVVTYPDSSPNAPLHAALRILRGEVQLYRAHEDRSYVSWQHGPYQARVSIIHGDPDCSRASQDRESVDVDTARYLADTLQRGEPVHGVCACAYA